MSRHCALIYPCLGLAWIKARPGVQGEYVSYKQVTSLVKFTDAESALRILTDASLRWSAPSLFNDPFELDHHSKLNFDSRTLLIACVKSTLGMIFSRDDPKGSSPLLKAVRRWRVEDRFDSEEEAQDVLSELLLSMVQQREPEMLSLMREWQQFSRSVRILCLTESHESRGVSMPCNPQ